MTLAWVNNERNRWAMRCDRCEHRDLEITWRRQPLEVYTDRGWWIAKVWGDLCPECRREVPLAERAEPYMPAVPL